MADSSSRLKQRYERIWQRYREGVGYLDLIDDDMDMRARVSLDTGGANTEWRIQAIVFALRWAADEIEREGEAAIEGRGEYWVKEGPEYRKCPEDGAQ
jgi:hypothetical protein